VSWHLLLSWGLRREVLNFVAYAFAPVTLVTPLGALAVIVSAVLSSVLLGEALNLIGKLGCFLCIIGSVLLVIHAPQEKEVTSLQELTVKLLEPGFLVYAILVFLAAFVLIVIFAPRFGQTHILVYISICSLLGAFTVASAKGLIIVLTSWILKLNFNLNVLFVSRLTHDLNRILFVSYFQVNYLNKSLDIFNTQMVYPIYYVFFTSVVLCTSIILFQEWSSMSPIAVVTTVGSFMVIVVGVAMLNLFRDSTVRIQPKHFKEEDKYGLIENMMIESLPPMGEEGPRVFIIS
uniref:Uncharacterized protein n=1 Tax=Periophthalmus magnuspinnatus TaxID=409849 RepID=A0A3B4A5W9_9GOBI